MLEKMLQSLPVAKVIGREGLFAEIDLSVDNNGLPNTENAGGFEDFIDSYLYKHNAVVAFGGYNEQRNLYKRSEIFNGNSEERNIHIGMDLWTKAGTPVLAALDGKIHSFDYNAGIGNYGPTIILEHQISQQQFYTLYGHLSLESISEIGIGETYSAGQQLATLGDASVNGDYAPHLHFQIIKDIQDNFGDYPGVCSKTDLTFYLENCPDPNLLLKLNKTK
jgi:murein DD-endopeptidase MepM/ murein hydrolase activator NlpD